MNSIGIYIHIPFCKKKCKYCDFISITCMDVEKIESYFECLIKEIEEKALELKHEIYEVDTIYIGGGTPSIVSERYIGKVVSKIYELFNISENVETTIEVNPGTVNEYKLKKYFEIGINRLSIGLQSTKPQLLKMLGRIHSYEEFENTYEIARNIGFRNINVDLMIGLPNQSINDVEESLKKIIEKSPEHISVYSLIVEEDTEMFRLVEKNILKLPSENLERVMYWKVKDALEKNGYKHYEISNFAKNNYESRHNLNCWNQHSYLGFGVAAHSYFGGMRYSNIDNIKQYIDNYKEGESVYNVIFHENQSKKQMMKEFMLLGLRKIEGVKINEFKEKFVDNPIYLFRNELNKLVKNELIEVSENTIKLTSKGLDFANLVWMEFV